MCSSGCAKFKKRKLSASDDGRGIKVAATATPGTLLHTATDSRAANEWDEVFLRAVNTSGAAVKLTIEWGGVASPDDQIEVTIPPEGGFIEVVDGHVLQNAKAVRAFAATANAIIMHGFVNRYDQTQ